MVENFWAGVIRLGWGQGFVIVVVEELKLRVQGKFLILDDHLRYRNANRMFNARAPKTYNPLSLLPSYDAHLTSP